MPGTRVHKRKHANTDSLCQDLSDCEHLSSASIERIAKHCEGLEELQLVGLLSLSDAAMAHLAAHSHNLRVLK